MTTDNQVDDAHVHAQLKLKHSWSRLKGQNMGLELSTPKWGFEAYSNNVSPRTMPVEQPGLPQVG